MSLFSLDENIAGMTGKEIYKPLSKKQIREIYTILNEQQIEEIVKTNNSAQDFNQDTIYIITMASRLGVTLNGWPDNGSTEVVGYYKNYKDAVECVENNNADIADHCYNYAIIEEVEEGVYPLVSNRWVYKYNTADDKFESCEEPKEYKHFNCFFA